ncbi:hypothetical protein X975_07927, partial [Stegodyphus mimosarum]
MCGSCGIFVYFTSCVSLPKNVCVLQKALEAAGICSSFSQCQLFIVWSEIRPCF